METEVPRTGLVVRLEETRFPIGRLAHGNRLAGREEICPAIAPEEPARAIGPAGRVPVIEQVVQAPATAQAEAEQIE